MLDKCCCCIPLQTGILVLAILGMIASSALFFRYLFVLITVIQKKKKYENYALAVTEYTFIVAFYLAFVITYACLHFGASKERRSYILPHLIVNGLFITLGIISNIFILSTIGPISYQPFLYLLACAVQSYFWVCALSYFRSLDPRNAYRSDPKVTYSRE